MSVHFACLIKSSSHTKLMVISIQVELHLITTTVTQPALAAIRFQFWRDALNVIWTGRTADGEEKPVPGHPIAVLLAEMKQARPIQKYYLSQLIDVRVSPTIS